MKVKPDMEQEFIDGADSCMAILLALPGCRAIERCRLQESPSCFSLYIGRYNFAVHDAFTLSPSIGQGRAAVGHCRVARARVWHGDIVIGT